MFPCEILVKIMILFAVRAGGCREEEPQLGALVSSQYICTDYKYNKYMCPFSHFLSSGFTAELGGLDE